MVPGSVGSSHTWPLAAGTLLSTLVLAPFLITWIARGEADRHPTGSILGRGMIGGIVFPFAASPITATFVLILLAPRAEGLREALVMIAGAPIFGALGGAVWALRMAPGLFLTGALFGMLTACGVLLRHVFIGLGGDSTATPSGSPSRPSATGQ